MKKNNSLLKILSLLALNDYLRKRRITGERNMLYENRLKRSEIYNAEGLNRRLK